jgi:hypothetical protein
MEGDDSIIDYSQQWVDPKAAVINKINQTSSIKEEIDESEIVSDEEAAPENVRNDDA